MMKRIVIALIACLLCGSAAAQDYNPYAYYVEYYAAYSASEQARVPEEAAKCAVYGARYAGRMCGDLIDALDAAGVQPTAYAAATTLISAAAVPMDAGLDEQAAGLTDVTAADGKMSACQWLEATALYQAAGVHFSSAAGKCNSAYDRLVQAAMILSSLQQ